MPGEMTRNARILATVGVGLALFLAALDQTIVGTALPRIVADLKAWKQAGLQRVLLQSLDQEDIAGLELFAREVMPKL